MWLLVGVVWLVADWIVNNEDQVFHVAVALSMAGLVVFGAPAGRGLGACVRPPRPSLGRRWEARCRLVRLKRRH